MRDFRYLLAAPEQGYRGTKGSFWFLVAMSVLVTVRSLIHMFAADGGANSIAGLTVEGDAGANLVHLFAQWGLEQLILAIVAWVVIVRYRFLVPFVLLLQLLDWFMRGVMGEIKPLVVESMPPGGIGNIIFVPLIAIALWFALPKSGERAAVKA
ncbi:MAG: hypothetical protein JSV07_04030 [Acidimicrobiia bacterium]|nr:MAG: hypothetical protein JSV07_04030 [Acidimicrobiia bacterium]